MNVPVARTLSRFGGSCMWLPKKTNRHLTHSRAHVCYVLYYNIMNQRNNSAHEYTEGNAKFAVSVEPNNKDLVDQVAVIKDKRSRGEPTVPSLLGGEKKANPFLRVDISQEIRTNVGVVQGDSDADAFLKVRKAKDNF
jgi:hypothetical protein